jgi:hypothetical protein
LVILCLLLGISACCTGYFVFVVSYFCLFWLFCVCCWLFLPVLVILCFYVKFTIHLNCNSVVSFHVAGKPKVGCFPNFWSKFSLSFCFRGLNYAALVSVKLHGTTHPFLLMCFVHKRIRRAPESNLTKFYFDYHKFIQYCKLVSTSIIQSHQRPIS